MTFYKIFHLKPGVKLTLNLIYGGGMKDVKIKMPEAQTQNWEKREKGESRQNSITGITVSVFISEIKKKTTLIVLMDFFFRRETPFPEM